MAIASTPAVGPSPTARTNSSAQTISGTLRRKINSPRTGILSRRDQAPERPPREAARNDKARLASRLAGTASSSASTIPAVATANVCRVASYSSSRNSPSCAGGQKALVKLAICWRFSACSSTPGFSSLNCAPGHSRASATRATNRRGTNAGSRALAFSIAGSAQPGPGPGAMATPAARWRRAHRASARSLPRQSSRTPPCPHECR